MLVYFAGNNVGALKTGRGGPRNHMCVRQCGGGSSGVEHVESAGNLRKIACQNQQASSNCFLFCSLFIFPRQFFGLTSPFSFPLPRFMNCSGTRPRTESGAACVSNTAVVFVFVVVLVVVIVRDTGAPTPALITQNPNHYLLERQYSSASMLMSALVV